MSNLSSTSRVLAATVGSGIVFICSTAAFAQDGSGWRLFINQGDALLKLQLLEKTEECYRQALRSVKKTPGATADDVALCQDKLASILAIQDIDEDSLSLYKKSVKILNKAHGKDSVLVIDTLMAYGKVQELDGEYKKALKLYTPACDIARKNYGGDSPVLAACLHSLGRANYKNGLHKEAYDAYRESLAITMRQESLPSGFELIDLLADYIDLAHRYNGPSKILTSQFEHELLKDDVGALATTRAVAGSDFESAVSLRFKTSGQTDMTAPDATPQANELLNSIAAQNARESALDTGIQPQGVDYYERMIAIDIKSLGADHPSVARDLKGLASVYIKLGRYDEARPLLERSLAIYEHSYSDKNISVKKLKALLALMDQVKSLPDTSQWAHTMMEGKVIPLASQTLEIAQRLNELAFISYSQGRLEDASTFYQWALTSTARATGERSTFTAACLKDYERVLRSQGNAAEAEKLAILSKSIMLEAGTARLLLIQ